MNFSQFYSESYGYPVFQSSPNEPDTNSSHFTFDISPLQNFDWNIPEYTVSHQSEYHQLQPIELSPTDLTFQLQPAPIQHRHHSYSSSYDETPPSYSELIPSYSDSSSLDHFRSLDYTPPQLPNTYSAETQLYPAPAQPQQSQQYPESTQDVFDLIVENSVLVTANDLLSQQQFSQVLHLLSSSSYPHRLHQDLQNLWLNTVYQQASHKRNGKHLNAVDRYRLRKRFPFPPTISNGDETFHLYKKSVRELLAHFFETNPYPSPAEKRTLAKQCELSYQQIGNFFKNKRGRNKPTEQKLKRRSSPHPKDELKSLLEKLDM